MCAGSGGLPERSCVAGSLHCPCFAAHPASAPCPALPPAPLLCLHPRPQVLSRANHQAGDMLRSVGGATAAAVEAGGMPPEVAERLMATYRTRLEGYTYMV